MRRSLLVAALLFVACASRPPTVLPPARDAWGEPPPVDAGRGRVVVIGSFEDRTGGGRCGLQKNDFGDDRGDIVCGVSPPQWVADTLAYQLTRSGFKVLRSEPRTTPPPDSLVVQGTVWRLFVEPTPHVAYRDVTAEIVVTMRVTTGAGLHEERNIDAKGHEQALVAGAATYQAVTDAATRDLAKRMSAEIVAIADHAGME